MDDAERQSRIDHFNAGAAGGEHETSYEADQRARSRSLYGSKDIEGLFPREAPITTAPWPSMARSKNRPKYDQEAVTDELVRPARTVDIDPRILSAGQPHVTRAGVAHYLSGEAEKLGQTYADHHNVGNQFPFVVTQPTGTGHQHVIISGHHRAAAALLRGERLKTRWIEET